MSNCVLVGIFIQNLAHYCFGTYKIHNVFIRRFLYEIKDVFE